MKEFIVLVSSSILSLLLIIVMFPLSKAINLLDRPDEKLKRHERAIPVSGGPVLFIMLLAGYMFSLTTDISVNPHLIIGLSAVFLLGIIDDYRQLSPLPKIIIQTIITIYIMITGDLVAVEMFPDFINYIITFLWIMGIMNAFNLMDIMDGFAGGIGLIIALTLLFINLAAGLIAPVYIMIVLSGFLVIFLFFNRPKARIYLGDSGSLTLGFLLAVGSIMTRYTSVNNLAFLTPLLVFGIPVFDTVFVIYARLLRGRNPLHGSPDHFVIKLLSIVKSRGFAVFIMILLQTVLSLFAYLSTVVNLYWAIAIYAGVLTLFVRIAFFIQGLGSEG